MRVSHWRVVPCEGALYEGVPWEGGVDYSSRAFANTHSLCCSRDFTVEREFHWSL